MVSASAMAGSRETKDALRPHPLCIPILSASPFSLYVSPFSLPPHSLCIPMLSASPCSLHLHSLCIPILSPSPFSLLLHFLRICWLCHTRWAGWPKTVFTKSKRNCSVPKAVFLVWHVQSSTSLHFRSVRCQLLGLVQLVDFLTSREMTGAKGPMHKAWLEPQKIGKQLPENPEVLGRQGGKVHYSIYKT